MTVLPKPENIALFVLIGLGQVLFNETHSTANSRSGKHFKLVHETPTTDDNGEPQSADDFQPRANIKKLVSEGALSSKEEVEQFSRKFAVEPDLMKAYIAHMQDLNIKHNIGARSCIEKKSKTAQKTVEEYPWLELVQSGGIKNYSFQC